MLLDKPNVVLPLASSYNERGVDGYSSTVTNAIDQRKINSVYEVVKNSQTGGVTLELVKRPGISNPGGTYGAASQLPYLVIRAAGSTDLSATGNWVFSRSGSDIRASDGLGVTTVIVTAAGNEPRWVDKTLISGVETVVLQIHNQSTNAQRTFYSNSIGTWTEITDLVFAAFGHRGKMEHLNGFAHILTSDNYIYSSSINTLATWPAINRVAKQIKQDIAAGLMRFSNQILAFGMNTVEVFGHAGYATGSPLDVIPSSSRDVGIEVGTTEAQKAHYYTTLGNRLYFVGNMGGSPRFSRSLIAYDGQSFEKVSTRNIDKILTFATKVYSVNRMELYGKAAVAIALTAPSSTGTQRWLMFFPEWNDWFEWTSDVYSPIGTGDLQLGIAGSTETKLYRYSGSEKWQDDTTDYTMTHQFDLPTKGNQLQRAYWMGVEGDTARSASSLNVELSRDDWQTVETARAIDMTKAKKHLYRCGSANKFGVRLSHTGNLDCRLRSFLARIA